MNYMDEKEPEIIEDVPGQMNLKQMAERANSPEFKVQYLKQIEAEYNPDLRRDHRPTQDSRLRVRLYKVAGVADKDIAKSLGISLIKLKKVYAYELAMGLNDLNAMVVGKMIEKINLGESNMIMFYLRCRSNFTPSTQQTIEHKVSISRPKEEIEQELMELGIPNESLKKLLEDGN